jgi:hypothetical protein
MGDEAENLIQQMKDETLNPSVIHYTSALNAWAKSADRNSLRRAEALFKTMEEKFPDLDRAAYHGLLLNYSTRGDSNKAERLLRRILDTGHRPSRATFTMVIDSHARSGSADAGQKAEALLDRMRELHAAGNNEVEVCSFSRFITLEIYRKFHAFTRSIFPLLNISRTTLHMRA